jgi:hypothetical protein
MLGIERGVPPTYHKDNEFLHPQGTIGKTTAKIGTRRPGLNVKTHPRNVYNPKENDESPILCEEPPQLKLVY